MTEKYYDFLGGFNAQRVVIVDPDTKRVINFNDLITQPSLTGVVSLTGTPAIGQTLTATFTQGYSGSLQWYRTTGVGTVDETTSAISGETSSTYVCKSEDNNCKITVRASSIVYEPTGLKLPLTAYGDSGSLFVTSTITGLVI